MDLSSKQLKFLEYFLQGKSQTESVVLAYGNQNRRSAAVQGARLMKNPKIQSALKYSLLGTGIFTEDLVKDLKNGLEAKKSTYDVCTKTWKLTDINDYQTQYKFLKIILQLKDYIA